MDRERQEPITFGGITLLPPLGLGAFDLDGRQSLGIFGLPTGRLHGESAPMDRLLSLLKEHALSRGTFKLSSGASSDFFIDCKPVVLRAEGHVLVGAALLDQVAALPGDVDAVAGVELGGCSLASAVAVMSNHQGKGLDAIYVRKSVKGHGTKKVLEGADHLERGARVVVLEDTVTSGGSTLAAIEKLKEGGLLVIGVVAIVDRSEGGADAIRAQGYTFASLYERRDFMGDA